MFFMLLFTAKWISLFLFKSFKRSHFTSKVNHVFLNNLSNRKGEIKTVINSRYRLKYVSD